MTPTHDLLTNIRLLSVQAGMVGGAVTAGLAATDAYFQTMHLALTIPPVLYAISGVLTGYGVFVARLWPQPNVLPTPVETSQKDGSQ